MVVRPAEHWTYGATPRYALAEQFQYAGNSAAPWLEPVQQAVIRQLDGKGWRSVPLDEADVWVAIGVAGSQDMSDGEIFSRLGMTPGLNAAANARKGTLAVVLLDGHSQKAVWSSAIQLASDVPSQRKPVASLASNWPPSCWARYRQTDVSFSKNGLLHAGRFPCTP